MNRPDEGSELLKLSARLGRDPLLVQANSGNTSIKLGGTLWVQGLLGHVSVQTTECYLGCKQRLRNAVNDHIGLEPEL